MYFLQASQSLPGNPVWQWVDPEETEPGDLELGCLACGDEHRWLGSEVFLALECPADDCPELERGDETL